MGKRIYTHCGNYHHNEGARKAIGPRKRGTNVNFAGGVSGKAFWRRGHLHGVLKEEQELTRQGVHREEGEGISRYKSSNRQKVQK